MTAADGRHTTASDGRNEVARRHGLTPAAQAREALRVVEIESPLLPPPRGYEGTLPTFKWRAKLRREQHQRWGIDP